MRIDHTIAIEGVTTEGAMDFDDFADDFNTWEENAVAADHEGTEDSCDRDALESLAVLAHGPTATIEWVEVPADERGRADLIVSWGVADEDGAQPCGYSLADDVLPTPASTAAAYAEAARKLESRIAAHKRATFIRRIDGWSGHVELFRVEPPMTPFEADNDAPREVHYVIASAAIVPYGGEETYLFPANELGQVYSWSELPASQRGTLSIDAVFRDAGYEVVR